MAKIIHGGVAVGIFLLICITGFLFISLVAPPAEQPAANAGFVFGLIFSGVNSLIYKRVKKSLPSAHAKNQRVEDGIQGIEPHSD